MSAEALGFILAPEQGAFWLFWVGVAFSGLYTGVGLGRRVYGYVRPQREAGGDAVSSPLVVLDHGGRKGKGAFEKPASRYLLALKPPAEGRAGKSEAFYTYATDKHLLTIAPTRTGKGRGLILPNLLDLPEHSVFVIDPKGENALVTASYRQSQGHEVLIFNPYGIHAETFAERGFTQFQSFNPLANLDPASPTFSADVANIAEALIFDTGGDSHWTEAARGYVEFLIMYLVTDPEETPTLRRLHTIISGGFNALREGGENSIRSACAISEHPLVRDQIGRYTYESSEVYSLMATAETQTRLLKNEQICAALEGEPLDFGRMKQAKTSVYLILPSEYLITQARYLRLVLLVAMSQFMRTEPGPHRVLMMLDEFANLGTLRVIENGYGLIAGHGVTLWTFVQNLTQLKNLYEKNWEVFLANSAVTAVFNINDVSTAEYFGKRAGQVEKQKTQYSEGQSHHEWKLFSTSSNKGSSTHWVWEDSLPVSRLYEADPDSLLIFVEGRAIPIQGRKLCYDRDEPFKSRARPNPMHRRSPPG